jgi:hypothetical protein
MKGVTSTKSSNKCNTTTNTTSSANKPMKVSSKDPVVDEVKVSYRWPASLPMMSHNLYWIRNNNQPCVCLGLDTNSLRTSG